MGILIGLVIAACVSVVVGALLIVFGTRLVMGRMATFRSAFLAALAWIVAAYVVALVSNTSQPGGYSVDTSGVTVLVLSVLIAGPLYAAIVKTRDGASPRLIQGYLIFAIQFAVFFALGATLSVLGVHLPGVTI